MANECLNGGAHKQAICAEDLWHCSSHWIMLIKPTPHLSVRHSENPEGVWRGLMWTLASQAFIPCSWQRWTMSSSMHNHVHKHTDCGLEVRHAAPRRFRQALECEIKAYALYGQQQQSWESVSYSSYLVKECKLSESGYMQRVSKATDASWREKGR